MNEENKTETEAVNLESKNANSDCSEEPSEPIAEILKDVPPESRKHVEKTLVQTFEMVSRFSPESSVLKKITPDHITKYLEDSGDNMRLGYKERGQNKIFIFALVVVALLFFTVLIVLLKDRPDLLENIIYAVVGLIAGAFGGYGVGKRQHNSDTD